MISNNTETNITINTTEQMDTSKMNKLDLSNRCKELGITKYSSKNKSQLIELINSKQQSSSELVSANPQMSLNNPADNSITYKLNMIDLFAGTGAFTLAFQSTNAVNVVFGKQLELWKYFNNDR